MKTIHLENTIFDADRLDFADGGYAYRAVPRFLKLPAGYADAKVASLCCAGGRIYSLVRGGKHSLLVFDTEGELLYIGRDDYFKSAHGLFAASDGTLLVTDSDRHVCHRVTPEGELISTLGELDVPSDTGYDMDILPKLLAAGLIETADMPNGLRLLHRLDSLKHRAAPFNRPTKLIECADGTLLCSDGYGNAAVHRFDADGKLLFSFGEPGRNPGQFRTVHAVWEDRRGRVWVADRENARAQCFSRDGELLIDIEDMLRATDFWEQGSILYISEADGAVTLFDTDRDAVAARIGGRNSCLHCHGLTGDADGNLYVACLGLNVRDRVIKLEKLK